MIDKDPNKNIQSLIVTGLDTYFAIKFQLSPITTILSQAGILMMSLKDEFLNKKLAVFFSNLKDLSDSERVKFHDHLGEDKEEFLKELLRKVDSLDEVYKADLLSKIYKATVLFRLDIRSFKRISVGIDRALGDDLKYFLSSMADCNTSDKFNSDRFQGLMTSRIMQGFGGVRSLVSNEFVEQATLNMYDQKDVTERFRPTKTGLQFFENID
ncbi:MAG: hypothetical protein WDO14_14160 [Bacteroidota bacterium]